MEFVKESQWLKSVTTIRINAYWKPALWIQVTTALSFSKLIILPLICIIICIRKLAIIMGRIIHCNAMYQLNVLVMRKIINEQVHGNNETTSPSVPVPVAQSNSSQLPNNEHPSPDNIDALDTNPSDSPGLVHHSGVAQCSVISLSPTVSDDSPTGSLDCDSPAVDLAVCSNIEYAMKDGVHGVSYTGHLREQGWTPVVGKRKKRSIPVYIK